MVFSTLINKTEKYVTNLIKNKLPAEMQFHNLQHTRFVVNAAKEIGIASKLTRAELATVVISAWFHDTGYCYAYAGHEDSSIAIAGTFLQQNTENKDFANEVVACINATRMPQTPQKLIQQVLCDADMFHLSQSSYQTYAEGLRIEWAQKLNKQFSDKDWHLSNINLLTKHTYFTEYGKQTLQPGKLVNIDKLLSEI